MPTPGSRVSRTSSIGPISSLLVRGGARTGRRPVRCAATLSSIPPRRPRSPGRTGPRTGSPAPGTRRRARRRPAARLARMIVNSPRATSDDPTLTLCAAGEARSTGPQGTPRPAYRRSRSARRPGQPDRTSSLGLAQVDLEAEGEEEDRGGEVAQARGAAARSGRGSREPDSRTPGQQGPDRLREPGGLAQGAAADARRASAAQQELLAVEPGRDAVDRVVRPAAHQQERHDEGEREAGGRRRPRGPRPTRRWPARPRRPGRARSPGPRTRGCRARGRSRRRPAGAGRTARG